MIKFTYTHGNTNISIEISVFTIMMLVSMLKELSNYL